MSVGVPSLRSRSSASRRSARRSQQRGLGLVDLLVGLAVGGIVVAASLAVFAQSVSASGPASTGLRMSQDLRAATALMARSVRQAVAAPDGNVALVVGDQGRSLQTYLAADAAVAGPAAAESSAPASVAVGFRLSAGTLEMRVGDGRWQALTDPQTVRVSQIGFAVEPPPADCRGAVWAPAVRWTIVAASAREPLRTESWSETVQVRHALPHPGCTA